MHKTGASLAVYALEQLGVRYTFGIPGVHNTELYDALDSSPRITPVLVTHELGAAFMADAVSRTSDSVGCLAVVPAAGITHAMSGIGEAYLAGVPMLILTGGIRRDTGRYFQLHDLQQQRLAEAVTKAAYLVTQHEDVVPTLYEAFEVATSGEPGPVLVELSADLQWRAKPVQRLPQYRRRWRPPPLSAESVREAATLLQEARHPGIYLGWGAREASELAAELADLLAAPVATTLQGLSVFSARHPLHTGMGFGPSAVPAARRAFKGCDCLLAVGVRFSELATGSYGMNLPKRLIHVDVNPLVFDRNYPAEVSIEGDASEVLRGILDELRLASPGRRDAAALIRGIAAAKRSFQQSWARRRGATRVGPGIFFPALRQRMEEDAYIVLDDGNHTFLAVEQFPVYRSKHFISPSDFNCMGYSIPAAIGVKLAHPAQQVVAVVGDGAFLMTAMELLTASRLQLGVICFVFSDGELGQIAQFQQLPLNRKTCTVLGEIDLEGVARATGSAFLSLAEDRQVEPVIARALEVATTGKPVIVDVAIDYSRRSEFTKGVVKVNFARFSRGEQLRVGTRAVKRRLRG